MNPINNDYWVLFSAPTFSTRLQGGDPQGSSRALGREARRNKVPFFVRKKSARLRGSQVIEEPCVSGEDSSSIRLALVGSSPHCIKGLLIG